MLGGGRQIPPPTWLRRVVLWRAADQRGASRSLCCAISAAQTPMTARTHTQRSGIRMGKPKVYVTRLIPDQGLKLMRDFCDATVWEDELPPPREVILREARDADGLVSLLTDKMDGKLMDACPKLRVVSNMAVGFDNIDV